MRTLFALVALVFLLGAARESPADGESVEPFGGLRFRHLGPVGNRVIAVAGIPGDRRIYYAGAASGGIWKTDDGGLNWDPISDHLPVHSIGSLAVAPSDPNIVWAGTGETFLRSNVSLGDGIWKSTDAGLHWEHMGLELTGRIGRVVIHPTQSNIVYAAALGHAYGPQRQRGIYRTVNGGETWKHILFVDENTGAADLVMDPNNPRILFAGMWQVEMKNWKRRSGGAGSAIYASRDSGDTWTRLEEHGLPTGPVGKIGLCMTPSESKRIYALIETADGVPWEGEGTESGELWRSDDGGEQWGVVSYDRNLAGRTAYYSRCAAAPDDADEAYFLTSVFSRTQDGGATTEVAEILASAPFAAPGGDHHDIWIDPTDGDRMIVGHDQGLSISENRSKSWLRVELPVAQMYHVTVDSDVPYHVLGNRQDGPSYRGPSNSRTQGAGISRGMWHSVGGSESGFATPDPVDPNIIWSSGSFFGAGGGIVVRYQVDTRQFRQVEIWPESTIGWQAAEVKYRFQWTFPLLVSRHDNNIVYAASQYVHRTTDGGQSWQIISPDLTSGDSGKQGVSGGLTPENVGVAYCCVISALEESPLEPGVLWAGSSDGLISVSRDAGSSWTDVTGNVPGLPPSGTVRNIDASKWAPGKAYVTVDLHEEANFEPFVYKTSDYGASWSKITKGISESVLSYARNIREDPVRPGLLYLGTENQLYVSLDDGEEWRPLRNNLPATPMYWLEVQEHFNDLVIGTYGRGFWILDDLTPLQQLTAEVEAAVAHLFEPRHTYRFRPVTAPAAMLNDPSAGEDPPFAAPINYWLRDVPADDVGVQLSIKNEEGELIRTLEATRATGVNRVWWDLRGEPTTEVRLRTKPLYADWFTLTADGTRSHPVGSFSVLHPPGTYTVTLQVGELEESRQLKVLKDPHSSGTHADIQLQTQMLLELHGKMNAVVDMIHRLEWIRLQLIDLQEKMIELRVGDDGVGSNAASLLTRFTSVQEKLIQLRVTGSGQDVARWPTMLAEKISYLASVVATADFRPTDQHLEVQAKLESLLDGYESELKELLFGELSVFNRQLVELGLPTILSAPEMIPEASPPH